MRDRGPIWRLGASALAALTIAGCTTLLGDSTGVTHSRTGENPAPVVPEGTDPDDALIGRREHPRIIASFGGVYEDRAAEVMVAQMAGKLLSAANRPNENFTVTILDSPEVNAFALPGGYIYVTRGILALANDESELATVLAHEMAHVTLRHARARSNKVRTTQIVDRVLGGILGADLDTDQSSARAKLSLAAFSQGQELEADREGIRIAARAGYDPHAAGRFLSRMGRFAAFVRQGETDAEEGDDFLSSHPSTPDRIEAAVTSARRFGEPGEGVTDRGRYLGAIDGIAFGINPEHGAVVGNRYIHPGLDFTFTVPGRYALTNTADAVVAVATDGAAMRFDSADVPADVDLAAYLRSGWVAGLDPDSVKTGRANGAELATADAATEKWTFHIAAVRYQGQVYRFIFAADRNSDRFSRDFSETIDSFRDARQSDLNSIRRYVIRSVTARSGESAESLARRMDVRTGGEELFYVLNGLFPGDALEPGTDYKIVALK
jgi:predicted Zn-dependent protease